MCPSCEKGHLHPTGAFWVCEMCGLVITQQALAFARASRNAAALATPAHDARPLLGEAMEGREGREKGQKPP